MLLRDDLPAARRTGTRAWADGDVKDAIECYEGAARRVHEAVADRYGCPSIDVIQALKGTASRDLDCCFRDDW